MVFDAPPIYEIEVSKFDYQDEIMGLLAMLKYEVFLK